MRLRVLSDLHVDLQADRGNTLLDWALVQNRDWDALVLAGDLCEAAHIPEALQKVAERAEGRPVVYVLGNHECWGSDPVNALVIACDAASRHASFHVLEMGSVEVLGQRFVGSTHWYKIPKVTLRDRQWSDFYRIMGTEDWVHARAKESAKFLAREVREGDVVVTHFLPHPSSIHPKWRGEPSNRFFIHDVRQIVEGFGAKLWVHGHTHSTRDFVAGRTRVLCNPFGYLRAPGEPNPEFDPHLTVDL